MSSLYETLTPLKFKERLEQLPVAYLPLGTLEWHGWHNPLGADGLQSQLFFEQFANKYGGIVLPKLFLEPDRVKETRGDVFYGMDFCTHDALIEYPDQQLLGSSYWVDDSFFRELLLNIVSQLHRTGFKMIVAHGHGPSVKMVQKMHEEILKYSMDSLTLFDLPIDDLLKFQNDHAAANETSIMMVLCPNLVSSNELNNMQEIAIAGRDPKEYASIEYGQHIIDANNKALKEAIDKWMKGRSK